MPEQVTLTIQYMPAKENGKEPQTNREVSRHEFAFLKPVINYQHSDWLYPTSDATFEVGDRIYTIQFNGSPRNYFLEQHLDIMPGRWRELFDQARGYLLDQVDSLMHVNYRSVAVGIIQAANADFVAYTLASSSGALGAPCFVQHSLERFCAIHRGSVLTEARPRVYLREANNTGMLVSDPVFVAAYKTFVIPDLETHRAQIPEDVKKFVN